MSTETKTKHAKEPWSVGSHQIYRWSIRAEDRVICRHAGEDRNSEANAARIVACVNACAGMEDPAKAIHKAIGLLETIRARSEASGDPFEALCAADAINVLGGYRDYLPPKP